MKVKLFKPFVLFTRLMQQLVCHIFVLQQLIFHHQKFM